MHRSIFLNTAAVVLAMVAGFDAHGQTVSTGAGAGTSTSTTTSAGSTTVHHAPNGTTTRTTHATHTTRTTTGGKTVTTVTHRTTVQHTGGQSTKGQSKGGHGASTAAHLTTTSQLGHGVVGHGPMERHLTGHSQTELGVVQPGHIQLGHADTAKVAAAGRARRGQLATAAARHVPAVARAAPAAGVAAAGAAAVGAGAGVASAAGPAAPAVAPVVLGGASGLPLPRFVALRSDQVSFRAGPGTRYPVDWVYQRRYLPVKVEREFEVWRLVSEPDGTRGWVHQAMLSGRRGFVVNAATPQTLRVAASDTAAPVAVLKPGVVGRLLACAPAADWCEVQVKAYRGFLNRTSFWGTLPGETVSP